MLHFMSVPPNGCQTGVTARRFLTTSVCCRGGERRPEPYGSDLPRTFRQISRRGRSVLCRPRGEEALQCLPKLLQSTLAENLAVGGLDLPLDVVRVVKELPPGVGVGDDRRSTVQRIDRLAYITTGLEIADEVADRLLGDARTFGEHGDS